MNATPVTVIGVLPESFDFGSIFSPGYKVDMYGPVIFDDIRDEGNTMALVGRLKPGVSLAQAQAEADLLFPTLHFSVKHPEYGGGYTGALFGLKDCFSDGQAAPFVDRVVVRGGPYFAYCLREPVEPVAGARGSTLHKEFAMRTALGATRGRLLRQLLTESLILSFAGALFGLAIALAITCCYLPPHQGSIALPLLSTVRIDGAALAWTLLVAVSAAVLFGLVPGLRIAGGNLQGSLEDRETGRRRQEARWIALGADHLGDCLGLHVAGGGWTPFAEFSAHPRC